MQKYEGFIRENIALKGAKRIGIYNADGNRVGQIPIGYLAAPNAKEMLYSFGLLADPHIGDTYASDDTDFIKALEYLNEAGVDLIIMNGDLTWNGTREQLQHYREIVDNHSPAPVFTVTGNHELYEQKSKAYYHEVIGHPMFYSFEHNGDVYLMLGTYNNAEDMAFSQASLQFAYDVLEKNRNKRCFVFQHIFPTSFGGAATEKYMQGIYAYDIWGAKGAIFEKLLRHYKNTVFFHGHSHVKFSEQESGESENYSYAQGYHSVHIPSVTALRDLVDGSLVVQDDASSEGYVVDVYKDGIHLRGRDFYNERFLPIASYWIDTPLVQIQARTFTDETGTITT